MNSLQCVGATSAIVPTGDAVADCGTAGGTVQWVESAGFLPDLSAADGAQLGMAIGLLWGAAFCIRAIRDLLEES